MNSIISSSRLVASQKAIQPRFGITGHPKPYKYPVDVFKKNWVHTRETPPYWSHAKAWESMLQQRFEHFQQASEPAITIPVTGNEPMARYLQEAFGSDYPEKFQQYTQLYSALPHNYYAELFTFRPDAAGRPCVFVISEDYVRNLPAGDTSPHGAIIYLDQHQQPETLILKVKGQKDLPFVSDYAREVKKLVPA